MPRTFRSTLGLPTTNKGRERVWWRGRYYDLGLAGSPSARAEYARLAALFASDPAANPRRPDELLIGELMADYFDVDEHKPFRDGSRHGRAVDLLLEHHAHIAVEEFQPKDFYAWVDGLASQKRPDGQPLYTRTYVGKLMRSIRSIWKWGVATGRVRYELLHGLETVDIPSARRLRPAGIRPAADLETVKATLPHLRGPVRVAVLLQLHTGARPSEILGLRPCDLVRSGKVQVPGAGWFDCDATGVWLAMPASHKTASHGIARALVIGPTMHAELLPLIEGRSPDAPLFSPRESDAEFRADMARRRRGGPGNHKRPAEQPRRRPRAAYTQETYSRAVRRACEAAGLPVWTPYQLRHLAAEQVDESHGGSAVTEFLGHASPAVTSRYKKNRAALLRAAEIAKTRA